MDNGRIAEKAKGVQIRDVRLFVMLSVIILLAELVCFYVKYPEGALKNVFMPHIWFMKGMCRKKCVYD